MAAVHSKEDLQRLLQKARSHVSSEQLNTWRYFYRDKTTEYFDDILENHEGNMMKYKKDFNGDKKSPINGRLDGLFFSTNVFHGTSKPVPWSVFGPRRLLIPADELYNVCQNLYFTDFYCNTGKHIVTLVMTRVGSEADKLCSIMLPSLEWSTNIFLRKSDSGEFLVAEKVWVEVFFTENVNIKPYLDSLSDVEMRGNRSGGTMGLPKNPSCPVCNL